MRFLFGGSGGNLEFVVLFIFVFIEEVVMFKGFFFWFMVVLEGFGLK